MNRNIIEEMQRTTQFQHLNKQHALTNRLLDQSLNKYRKDKTLKSLENSSRDRNFNLKEKYRNFGEEQFIKKLKINSTKQVDKKSIKTIQKYLQDLNHPKKDEQIFIINGSLLRNQDQYYLNNQPSTYGSQQGSLQYIQDSYKQRNYNQNNEQQDIFNEKNNDIQALNNQQIQKPMSQFYKQRSLVNKIQNKSKFIKSNINSNGINYRNNQSALVSQIENIQQHAYISQTINKDLKVTQQGHYNKQRQTMLQKHQAYQNERPTIDTQTKILSLQTSSKNLPKSEQTNSFKQQQLKLQVIRLQKLAKEQSQIIELQQIMILKLNKQLQKATNKISQNEKLLRRIQKMQKVQTQTTSIERIHLPQFELRQTFGKHTMSPCFENQSIIAQYANVQEFELFGQFQHNYNKLKDLLTNMDTQTTNSITQNNMISNEFQQYLNAGYQSKNQFYHKKHTVHYNDQNQQEQDNFNSNLNFQPSHFQRINLHS